MTNAVKKNGVNFGIILAVYLVLRTAIMYAIDINLFVNSWIGFTDIIVTIVLGIIAIAKAKRAMGGYVNFKEAFTTFFITFVIGLVAYTLFNIILWNVIDPEAKETLREISIEKIVQTFQAFGNSNPEVLKETVAKMRETDSFAPAQQLLGLGMAIVMYSVIGLIVAVAMKKNKPEFE